jgi:hypothetical protein
VLSPEGNLGKSGNSNKRHHTEALLIKDFKEFICKARKQEGQAGLLQLDIASDG